MATTPTFSPKPWHVHRTGSYIGIKNAAGKFVIRKGVSRLTTDQYQQLSDNFDQIVASINPPKGPDYERMFFRCKRALAHLHHKNHELDSERCNGCLEVVGFLTKEGYRGEVNNPIGVDCERQL